MKGYRSMHRSDCGLTKVELVAVAALCGLLGAIALPSFLNQACACKSPESEAATYVGSLARAQQAFLLENRDFSDSWVALGLGIPSETTHYAYEILAQEREAIAYATPKSPELHGYVSGVFLLQGQLGAEEISTRIICKAERPGPEPLAPPLDPETCGPGTELYGKSDPR